MNGDETLTCPHCGGVFALKEALSHEALKNLLEEERERIRTEESRKAEPQLAVLRDQLQMRERERAESIKREVELNRQVLAFKQQEEARALERQRELVRVREEARVEADKAAVERFQAEVNQKDQQLAQMAREAEELRRKASAGSAQQVSIEGQKLLGAELAELFPQDTVEVIRQGQRGADVKHQVCSRAGRLNGTILWEWKDAQAWSDAWLEKIQADAKDEEADVAVIVSRVLPKDIGCVAAIKSVIVLRPEYVEVVAKLLRRQVLIEARHRLASMADEGTAERVLRYITGPFGSHLSRTLEQAEGIKEAVAAEQRAMNRRWGDQLNRAERIVREVTAIAVELDAQGAQLPSIPPLELPAA